MNILPLPSWQAALAIVVSCAGAYILVIGLTRLFGLRSFSKMSAFDFVLTVAVGSMIAATVLNRDQTVGGFLIALFTFFVLKESIGWARRRWELAEDMVDNSPMLLMKDGRIYDENLRTAQVTRADLMGKLRHANVHRLAEVRAVVMETTGDFSIIHGDTPVDDILMKGVVNPQGDTEHKPATAGEPRRPSGSANELPDRRHRG